MEPNLLRKLLDVTKSPKILIFEDNKFSTSILKDYIIEYPNNPFVTMVLG